MKTIKEKRKMRKLKAKTINVFYNTFLYRKFYILLENIFGKT